MKSVSAIDLHRMTLTLLSRLCGFASVAMSDQDHPTKGGPDFIVDFDVVRTGSRRVNGPTRI